MPVPPASHEEATGLCREGRSISYSKNHLNT